MMTAPTNVPWMRPPPRRKLSRFPWRIWHPAEAMETFQAWDAEPSPNLQDGLVVEGQSAAPPLGLLAIISVVGAAQA